MHSRKQDYVTMTSPVKVRNQIRVGVGHDSYGVSPHGVRDHSPRVQLRSLSPRGRDMTMSSRRVSLREGRSTSIERKDNSWRFGVRSAGNIQSGSPLYVEDCKMPRCNERTVHKNYEHIDDTYYDYGKNDRLNQVYYNDHHIVPARMSMEKEYFQKGVGSHEMMGSERIIPVEDGMTREAHHLPPDFVVQSNYRGTGEHLTLPPRHLDVEQFEDEKIRYRSTPLEKRRAVEIYQDEEEPIFHSRYGPYTRVPVSYLNNFGSSSRYKNFAGTSSGVSRDDFAYAYQESVSLPTSNEHPRGSVKQAVPVGYNTYGQNLGSDARDFVNDKKILSYEQGSYTPTRNEHDVYLYTDTQIIANDNYGHPLNDLERRIPAYTAMAPTQSRIDNEQRELRRTSTRPPAIDGFNHINERYGDMKNTRDHLNTEKQKAKEDLETERMPYRGHSQVEFGRRTVHDDEASSLGVSQDHTTSHVTSNFGFGRDSGPRFPEERLQSQKYQEEKLQNSRFLQRFQDPIIHEERLHGSICQEERFQSPGFQKESRMPLYDAEMQKHAVKRHRMREEDALYDASDKGFKRKFLMDEDIIRHDKRSIAPSAWNEPKEYVDPYESREEWIEKDTFGLHEARNQRFDHQAYRKVKRTYNGRSHAVNAVSENWLRSQDSVMHTRRHPVNKPIIYTKGHPKAAALSYYKSNQHDGSNIQRHNKPWKTTDDCDEDAHANDDNPSEEWMEHPGSEPPEDSEDFKQLVEESFLLYSKSLNLNSGVRRRYMEQGKAGSLFCIVCGKSASKEFMDTRRLVTHAFMSHKAGLRARHLGLHKAVCVLMGWNSYAPCDTVTWVPDVLPSEEALAQKENLMLWPPLVVIHNISMTNNNPERQKVVPLEEVEAFLRGKGFVGGKIKVCLGKPADQSVMLVKFLGTFTGLASAERLHKYFVEKKRSREEFETKTSNNSKSSYNWEDEIQEGEKLEEQLLYGYLGIADDLDRLDFHTKKWIIIKSKKEIQDLANAPVKTDDK